MSLQRPSDGGLAGFFSFFPGRTFQKRYLRFALPLLFFCALLFLGCGGGWAASLTASSQKPMLELWASPQMLLESEPQLAQGLVLTDPHTELLRDVCKKGKVMQLSCQRA